MIRKLTIRNFQNHADTELDFAPGINVIVGSSDSGKSAIVRALEWVRTNRPLGTSFLRHGMDDEDMCSVAVECVDRKTKIKVERRRGKNANEYRVDKDSMKAIGSDVPQQVTDTLRIDDLNIQHQLSPHFLILESPGVVGKTINAACHLEEMDECVAEGKRQVRTLQGEVAKAEVDIEDWTKELVNFEDLDQIRDEVVEAQALYDELVWMTKNRNAVELIMTALMQVEQEMDAIPDAALVREAMRLLRETELLSRDAHILNGAVSDLAKVELELGAIPNADVVTAVTKVVDKLALLQPRRDQLESVIGGIVRLGDAKAAYDEKAEEAKQKLFSAMDGVACPACGRVFDDVARTFIVGE